MSIFKRIRNISAAAINDLIDRAEDPVKMLNQYIRDMESEIADAEVAVAKQIAVEKKFKHQYEESAELVEKRQAQALQALESGNEDLARRVLIDKKAQQQKCDEYKQQFDNAKADADALREQLKEMKSAYEKMKLQKDTLVARASAAKAQKQMNQAMSGIGKSSAAKDFERMSEKVLQMEAEAETSRELRESSRTLDDEIAALEDSGIDDELAALKEQLAARSKEAE